MRAGKIIAFITAAIFIIFSFLMIWGAFDPVRGDPAWIIFGLIGMVIGFILIFVGTKLSPPQKAGDQTINLNVDLPGQVGMDTIKCQACGGPITTKDVKMIAGAPVVECPHCSTTYQLTEEPKW